MWEFLQGLVNSMEWVRQFFLIILVILVSVAVAWVFGSIFLGAIIEILGIGA
jgi:hypothetical protein